MLSEGQIREPGDFIKLYCPEEGDFDYYQLVWRDYPLVYPLKASSVTLEAYGASDSTKEIVLEDLQPEVEHIYQVFLGIKYGLRFKVFQPTDQLLHGWDKTLDENDVTTTAKEDTQWIDNEMSPFDDPRYEIWVIRDYYPQVKVENLLDAQLSLANPFMKVEAAKFTYVRIDEVKDAELHEKLSKRLIRSLPVMIGRMV